MTRAARWIFVGCVVLAVAGCTGGTKAAGPDPASAVPTSAAGLGGGDGEQASAAPRSTILTTPSAVLSTQPNGPEADGTCPYISNDDFHEYEGDHVGRVTLIQTKPVGCRFYFDAAWGDPSDIIGEVAVQQFADAKTAFNTMVLSSKGHPEVQSSTTIGDGAVAYRTELQGEQTWQCVVTVANTVYTVRTRQSDLSKDAFNLASALVATVTKAK